MGRVWGQGNRSCEIASGCEGPLVGKHACRELVSPVSSRHELQRQGLVVVAGLRPQTLWSPWSLIMTLCFFLMLLLMALAAFNTDPGTDLVTRIVFGLAVPPLVFFTIRAAVRRVTISEEGAVSIYTLSGPARNLSIVGVACARRVSRPAHALVMPLLHPREWRRSSRF